MGLLRGPRGSAKGVMPAPAPAVPDPPRWTPRQRRASDAGEAGRDVERRSAGATECRRLGGVDQAAIAAPAKAASARSPPRARPARPARASTTCSATRRRGRPPRAATPNSRPPRAASIHRTSVTQRSRADPPTVALGLTRRRMETLVSPRAYAVERQGDRSSAVPPPDEPARGDPPPGPPCTRGIGSAAPSRTRLSGAPAAATGPRTCRSTMPCPTMTSRPPTGRAAAAAARARRRPRLGARRHPRHPGLDPQRARDEPLRCSVSARWARSTTEEGQARPKRGPLRRFPAPPCPALYKRRDRDGHHARLAGRPGGAPPATASPPSPSRRRPARGRG